ncbi:hypothetical protein ELG63_28275 (plasmid) [Rhizobium leguminosarum]|nr:hypothetical protein [Rhizobium leguminosarum]TBF70348.1 hypothetical protein ELG89_26335 [Rhizobium leguminosarum]TBG49981.1 hypothetical protein ELG71_36465 [Rhizobium leguminosarum]TBH32837.1 hypothetical protein ELG63_28275 [Rhizobium leguminosarum]
MALQYHENRGIDLFEAIPIPKDRLVQMDTYDLRFLRTGASLTKPVFAQAMGMPLRTYEDVEDGKVEYRPIHINAAQWALVKLCADGAIPNGLPIDVESIIERAHKEIKKRGQP